MPCPTWHYMNHDTKKNIIFNINMKVLVNIQFYIDNGILWDSVAQHNAEKVNKPR